MSYHAPFDFKSSAELLATAEALNLQLPFSQDVSSLLESSTLCKKTIPNRLVVQPMEGADAQSNGAPSELTVRRYRRYAEGGSGIIWFEATAVVPEGRSNPRQLLINNENLSAFKNLVDITRNSARKMYGDSHQVFCVLQLTHSGRYCRPEAKLEPMVACYNPLLDENPDFIFILNDEYLHHLKDSYTGAAFQAYQAGFDAVDIKSCHGYLVNDLLAAYTREHSQYGQGFENRTRFLLDVTHKIHALVPDLLLAVRLSAFDGLPFPYGFGFLRQPPLDVDLTEAIALIRRLVIMGCSIINISAGNPYHNPHVGRPYDRPFPGSSLPEEHPLEGIVRLLQMTSTLQNLFPDLPFVGSGYSWLRQFFPQVAAAVIAKHEATYIGLGRSSLAYPDAPKDLMVRNLLDASKVCITCSRCSELMRRGHICGCVIRDKEIYEKEYRELRSS